ncbi:hypothetical protein TNCV_831031 [Trichonephila clavipes]|nr:hypothetical protein TNCV_831031 [Trichonephila clavipes]
MTVNIRLKNPEQFTTFVQFLSLLRRRTCPDCHQPLNGPNCSNDVMTLANSPPMKRPRCEPMHVYTPDVTSSPTSLRPCAAGSAQQIKVECGLPDQNDNRL